MNYIFAIPPVGGVKTDLPDNVLKDHFSPYANGMWSIDGNLTRIPGKNKFSQTQLDGPVLCIYSLHLDILVNYLLCATPTTLYVYDPGSGQFNSIQDTPFTTLANEQYAVETFFDASANQIFIISNLRDTPRKWEANDPAIAPLGGDPPNATSYCVFNNYLLAGNVVQVDDGDHYPRRVRYSALSNAESWPSENYFDLMRDTYPIVAIKRIGSRAAIYKAHSISLLSYVGGDLVFDLDENYVGDKGAVSQDSIVVFGEGFDAHYFIARDMRVYRFDGVECIAVSDAIEKHLRMINSKYFHLITGTAYRKENKVVWAVPYDTDEHCYDLVIFDTQDRSWWIKQGEPVAVHSWGHTLLSESSESIYTWDTLPYDSWDTWDDPNGWGTRHLNSSVTKALVGGADGYVRRLIPGSNDDGVTIESEYRYPFLTLDGRSDRRKLLKRINVEMVDTSDEWLTLQVFTDGNDRDPVVLNDDGESRIKINLAANGPNKKRVYQAIDVYVLAYSFQFVFTADIMWTGKVVAVEYELDGRITDDLAHQIIYKQEDAAWGGEEIEW